MNPGLSVKSIPPFLILVSLVTGLFAQPAPTVPAAAPAVPATAPVVPTTAPIPAAAIPTNRDALRQSLERTFAQVTNPPGALAAKMTNSTAAPTNPAAGLPAPASTIAAQPSPEIRPTSPITPIT